MALTKCVPLASMVLHALNKSSFFNPHKKLLGEILFPYFK